ncbi:MAG: NAD+ synthase [Planctomycetota bacterium]|jgi:NAD+ synthase
MLSASAADAPRTDPEAAARVLQRALAAEVRRAGFDRVVLGLSGGIDSAASCLLAANALGPGNVTALALPVSGSSDASIEHARLVADAAGIELETVDLSPVLEALESTLPGSGDDRMRRGNLAARARMIALYDRSAAIGALVLGTSNKTEALLGYTTLWGDMAAAIQPLGDLYKTEVRSLARHLGCPDVVVDKPPTADLWAGQTDEDELGFTYAEADLVLFQWLDMGRKPEHLIEHGFDERLVTEIHRRVVGSAFKRTPAIVLKVSARTVGMEYRLPRDAGT